MRSAPGQRCHARTASWPSRRHGWDAPVVGCEECSRTGASPPWCSDQVGRLDVRCGPSADARVDVVLGIEDVGWLDVSEVEGIDVEEIPDAVCVLKIGQG